MSMIAVSELLKGLIILNLLLSPLTLCLTFYIAIMGGSNPDSPGFLRSFGITTGFIYGTPIGLLVWLIAMGKLFDLIFQIAPIVHPSVSCLSIFIAAVLFVIVGNVFIDHLYQLKQGNYMISIVALLMILLYTITLYFSAKIPIPWLAM
ncbi:hypothetical protein [Alkalinema sp. FACHB-956]|uniref:hypothetical protein n=1 Tax=Alkalinema sp. FACHB-956 TaxID=2692768 RepID=UPI001685A9C1|nr:hypothetical protein [Alkalinema sp. FACHB-956]MBD2326876.1 hypothetical protein [Alkalinema sp. FACHB-956]